MCSPQGDTKKPVGSTSKTGNQTCIRYNKGWTLLYRKTEKQTSEPVKNQLKLPLQAVIEV